MISTQYIILIGFHLLIKILMKNQKQVRREAIAKAKQSISKLSIISRNVNMVNDRINRSPGESPDNDDSQSASCMTFDQVNLKTMADIDTFNEKYQLGRKIGEGASGIVRQCLHIKKNKIYACKSMMFDDEHIPLMEKSFSDVRRLDHSNIVRYKALYLDLEKHLAYLVMQFINLPNLMEYVSTLAQPIQQESIKWIFQQLFKTLQHMHSKGISHRDIKPDNIMIDGEAKKIKIIDFGIAKKMIVRKQKVDMLTITGTLFYRAPEMFLGGGYSEKVDIWAAGVTLYQVMYGKTPFASEYHSETIQNIQNMEIQKQQDDETLTNVSDVLKDLIYRLLRKDPQERFTAKQALSHLWFYKKKGKTYKRLSDVGHVIQTQYSKFKRTAAEVDLPALRVYNKCYQIKKTHSPTYLRMQVQDF